MNQSQFQTLVNKYLSGQATTEEAALVDQWLDAMAAKGTMPGGDLSPEEKELLRRKMFLAIRKRTGQLPQIKSWRRWVAAAAVVLPPAVAAWWFTSRSKPESVQYPVLSTGIGEQKMIHLGDSSRIWLAPNSRLRYPETFRDGRQVTLLSGEAYFDVARQPEHPFSVKVESLQVDVLGTAFNIRAYKNAPSVAVAVSNGKIRVMHGVRELGTLTEQQQILVAKGSYEISRHQIAAENIEAWKNDRLFFDNTPLAEVLHRLEDYYPVRFETVGEMAQDIRISGSFNLRMKPENIMSILEEFTGRVHFKATNKGIYTVTIQQ
ncbi:FecR domain-containing protein [Chitinophaga sedimenti]|uniref:FecR family protein n=1 Tax=Chitinophaga sedimenti TaxID=2033606 RepID=UPI0020049E90|nr:FecR domain-containing protein [Chitinophaga sedimenti]MCK7558338.1 FecR domain-containing protein [Chitinophaga sedimenti]